MTERQILTDSTLTGIVHGGAITALLVAVSLHYLRAWRLGSKYPQSVGDVKRVGRKKCTL